MRPPMGDHRPLSDSYLKLIRAYPIFGSETRKTKLNPRAAGWGIHAGTDKPVVRLISNVKGAFRAKR